MRIFTVKSEAVISGGKSPHGFVWITRTPLAAKASAERVRALGFEAVVGSLIDVAPVPHVPDIPPDLSTIIFTSRNAVAHHPPLPDMGAVDVFAVGDATAHAARNAGFTRVKSANGNVDNLYTLIAGNRPDGMIWHLSGAVTRGDLTTRLITAGLRAQNVVIYRQIPALQCPDVPLRKLTHVMFYSPLAAKTFAQLAPECGHVTAISISPATDKALGCHGKGNMAFSARKVASAPREDVMLAELLI